MDQLARNVPASVLDSPGFIVGVRHDVACLHAHAALYMRRAAAAGQRRHQRLLDLAATPLPDPCSPLAWRSQCQRHRRAPQHRLPAEQYLQTLLGRMQAGVQLAGDVVAAFLGHRFAIVEGLFARNGQHLEVWYYRYGPDGPPHQIGSVERGMSEWMHVHKPPFNVAGPAGTPPHRTAHLVRANGELWVQLDPRPEDEPTPPAATVEFARRPWEGFWQIHHAGLDEAQRLLAAGQRGGAGGGGPSRRRPAQHSQQGTRTAASASEGGDAEAMRQELHQLRQEEQQRPAWRTCRPGSS